MSRETANAARYAKGLCVLTELEGDLLEAVEAVWDRSCTTYNGAMDKKTLLLVRRVIVRSDGRL